MFVCSRCGSSYNARHIGVEHCPRCRLRDKIDAPLAFKAFDLSGLKVTSLKTPDRTESSGSGPGIGASA
jgi:hypothetical protein